MSTGLPVTIYRSTNGLYEYSGTTPEDVIDTAGISLVDTTGEEIVDTGVVATRLPGTTWEEDDAA